MLLHAGTQQKRTRDTASTSVMTAFRFSSARLSLSLLSSSAKVITVDEDMAGAGKYADLAGSFARAPGDACYPADCLAPP